MNTDPSPKLAIEHFLEQLDRGGDPRQIKQGLVALILKILDQCRHQLTAEQKQHVVNAVGTLSMKRGSGKRMTARELRIVIVDLQKGVAASAHPLAFRPRPMQSRINNLVNIDMLRRAVLASLQRASNPYNA